MTTQEQKNQKQIEKDSNSDQKPIEGEVLDAGMKAFYEYFIKYPGMIKSYSDYEKMM